MRFLAFLCLIAALAGGLWAFLGSTDAEGPLGDELTEPIQENPINEPADLGAHHSSRLRQKFGTLSITVRTIGGEQALLAEVGYLKRDDTPRWFHAHGGKKTITDAPLGEVVAVARAAGYGLAKQPCQVIAGVPAEVVLVLRPGKEAPAEKSKGGKLILPDR